MQNHINKCRKKYLAKFNSHSWQKLSKLGIERNLIKNTTKNKKTKNPVTNIILNGEKLEIFPLRLWARQECFISSFLFNNVLQVLVNAVRQMEIKCMQVGNEDINFFFFRWHDFLYTKPKRHNNNNKTLLELISSYNQVAGYKFHIQKLIIFLFINNEQMAIVPHT